MQENVERFPGHKVATHVTDHSDHFFFNSWKSTVTPYTDLRAFDVIHYKKYPGEYVGVIKMRYICSTVRMQAKFPDYCFRRITAEEFDLYESEYSKMGGTTRVERIGPCRVHRHRGQRMVNKKIKF